MKKILTIFSVFTILGLSTSAFAAPYGHHPHKQGLRHGVHHHKMKPQIHQHYHYSANYRYSGHHHRNSGVAGGILVGALLGGIIGGIVD